MHPSARTFAASSSATPDLPNAVRLNSTSFNAARMIRPAISAPVIRLGRTGWAFLINGVSFVAVLLLAFALRSSTLHANERAQRAKGSFTEGIVMCGKRRTSRRFLVMLFLMGTFGLNFPIFHLDDGR